VASLSIWRFLLGIGIGGDYPLSAVLTSEYSNVTHRGAQIAAVFAMQGFGILVGAATVLILLQIFPTTDTLDYVWRFAVAIGVIPAIITAYFRFQIPETPRFLMDVKNDYSETVKAYNFLKKDDKAMELSPMAQISGQEAAMEEKKGELSFWALMRRSSWVLFGTAVCWFILDIAFYSQSLFQPAVLSSIQFFTNTNDIMANLQHLAIGQFCIALLGTVPGYWATVFTVDRMGRRNIQLMGFIIMMILYLILAVAFVPLTTKAPVAFVVLYTLTFFFTNFGPNVTTFILPSEVFPTKIRSTAHGISAACGKSGAILGAFGFAPFSTKFGLPATMGFFVGILFIGVIVTWLFTPETAQKTLEQLENVKTPIEGGAFRDLICFRSCTECTCRIPLHEESFGV
jgi:PHS family inorganic phosphate transporter-like MFS transporter